MSQVMAVPLQAQEEVLWRSLMRLFLTLPRLLEDDLERGTGLSMSAYTVLSSLSEAPSRQLRMSELAHRAALSASRITRVVDELGRDGLVSKIRCEGDGRGNLAVLTDAGLDRLEAAWPEHLAAVRRYVVDHLGEGDLSTVANVLSRLADVADDSARTGR